MKQYFVNICQRYKLEIILGLGAAGFFLGFILPEIMKNSWGPHRLRTMLFTLFGIVGLMGLSIGIKRHEQVLKEHREVHEGAIIQRMHNCVQQLSSEASLPVCVGALHEIEKIFEQLSPDNQEFLCRVIAVLTQVPVLPRPGGTGGPVETTEYIEKRGLQIEKRNYAFRTLKRITNNQPVATIRKYHALATELDFRYMSFRGAEMALDTEDLTHCNFSDSRFMDTKITNCQIDRTSGFSFELFYQVAIDGTDFNDFYSTEYFKKFIGKILDGSSGDTTRIYYSEKRPHRLCTDDNEKKVLQIIHLHPPRVANTL